MAKPLEGIRVVELATMVAAPTAAKLLGDLGAEVIKVESFAGDARRENYIFKHNYDTFTSIGGEGLAGLVEISFRGPAIASTIAATTILIMRKFIYNAPSINKETI